MIYLYFDTRPRFVATVDMLGQTARLKGLLGVFDSALPFLLGEGGLLGFGLGAVLAEPLLYGVVVLQVMQATGLRVVNHVHSQKGTYPRHAPDSA